MTSSVNAVAQGATSSKNAPFGRNSSGVPRELGAVTSTKPLRILLVSSLEWAFGRIAFELKRSLEHSRFQQRYLVDIRDWLLNVEYKTFDGYDLVYLFNGSCAEQLMRTIEKKRVCWGPHCVMEFWTFDPVVKGSGQTTKEEMSDPEHRPFAPTMQAWLTAQRSPIGCVSQQLVRMLVKHVAQRCERSEHSITGAVQTRCGVADSIVDSYAMRLDVACARPKVLLQTPPVRADGQFGYDAKRMGHVQKLIDRTQGVVDWAWPDRKMSHAELDLWYDQQRGDICLCMSHTEGNPLGLIEGIGRGLVPVTTSCGVAPEIVEDGVNGFITRELNDENKIIDEMEVILTHLASNREALMKMKRAAWDTADREWRWSTTVNSWAAFFDSCHTAVK